MDVFNLIDRSDIEGVKAWIDNEITDKNVDKYGESPLLYALMSRKKDIAKLFVTKELYIFKADGDGYTPLHYAVLVDHCDITLLLIGKGANVNSVNKYGRLPIHYYAAHHGKSEIIRILIENGSEINAIDKWNGSPLDNSICWSYAFEASKMLLDEGAALFYNINYLASARDNKNKTLLKHHLKLQAFILVCKEKDNIPSCPVLLRFSKTFKLSFKE